MAIVTRDGCPHLVGANFHGGSAERTSLVPSRNGGAAGNRRAGLSRFLGGSRRGVGPVSRRDLPPIGLGRRDGAGGWLGARTRSGLDLASRTGNANQRVAFRAPARFTRSGGGGFHRPTTGRTTETDGGVGHGGYQAGWALGCRTAQLPPSYRYRHPPDQPHIQPLGTATARCQILTRLDGTRGTSRSCSIPSKAGGNR